MIDDLLLLSRHFLKTYHRDFKRYFLTTYSLENRFSIIIGPRGVGKTTAIIQYILSTYNQNDSRVLYLPVDHYVFGNRTLYDTTEEFYNHGGELICFDEIHKYPNWAQELKSIFDSFPGLKIIASGSSALQIQQASHDISRRAVVYRMTGLSFREYINLRYGLEIPSYSLEDILHHHEEISTEIISILESHNYKILVLFKDYLKTGYYPYFPEYPDTDLYSMVLEQGIHTTIESDLLTLNPTLSGVSIQKINKLLSIIASSVPFTPDLTKLKQLVEIGDERTLKIYIKYLESGGILHTLYHPGKGLRQLEKPGKIYLNNPNQIHAICPAGKGNIGNIRETFFLSMLRNNHSMSLPRHGDFLVDDNFLFEVGGKNKGFSQIKDEQNSYLALDELETGIGKKIPLWLFGFLY